MSKQVFNALSGGELKKAILAELDKELDKSGEFGNHITYPWIRFEASIRVLSYPKQQMEDEPRTVAVASGEIATHEAVDYSLPVVEVANVQVGQVIDTPDQARVDSGQPIPVQASAAGVQIDKFVDRPKSSQAKPLAQVKPVSATTPALHKVTNNEQRERVGGNPVAEGSPAGIPGIDGSL